MNIWHFSGRLGRDAELRTTQSGEKVLGFAVANDVGFGERKTTQWVDCSIWGKRAEALAPHLKRGMEVSVAGEVVLREIERRGGEKDKVLSVTVMEIDLHGGQRTGQQTDAGTGNRTSGQSNGTGESRGTADRGTADTGSQAGKPRQEAGRQQARPAEQGRANGKGGKGQDWDEIPF
ncbi:single-stranded DNA-binding protein [Azospirillum sp. SYSU D00513]|uniref:single-stranded DNA-binding protein n=1 Tax=Azospirillum sp. SYSU D00513 TaxID=2812561 RepID=UPI001A9772FA|nr:single-stranded DNA-binding protein [Azospirillum sp. SYSU D00513]